MPAKSDASAKAAATGPARARTLSDGERINWLRLIRSENVGPGTFFRLLNLYGTAEKALEALPDIAGRGGARRRIRIAPIEKAEKEMAAIRAAGASAVAWGEPEYPPLLCHIHDPPPVLSVRGRPELLKKKSLGVVGARNASINGCRFAEKISADLGQGGLLIASGMARGIDAAAHRGAIATGTAAVLGGGVDVVYPKENQDIYDRIAEEGVVLSEAPPGTQPQARHFPRRNRIISGMSRGVLVVEASPRSGSLITARMALEQGREVFAVPGAAMDPRARGTNKLIREGAYLVENADDVLIELNALNSLQYVEKNDDFEGESSQLSDTDDMETARDTIVQALGPSPSTVDELRRVCQFSPAVVSMVLLELELAGRLERHPGNKVSILIDP